MRRCWPNWMNSSTCIRQRHAMPEAKDNELSGPEEIPSPTPLFEAAIGASLVVAVLSLFLFTWLGREVMAGSTQQFDFAVRNWVHGFASPGMTKVMTFISLLGYNILIVEWMVALGFFAWMRWRRAAVWLTIAVAGSLA